MAKPRPLSPATLHQDIHDLFSGPLGTRVLKGLRNRYHDTRTSTFDPYILAAREGRRDVILTLELYATTKPEDDGNVSYDAPDDN